MGYESALQKSWDELAALNPAKVTSIKFLNDEYSVDVENRRVLSLSCNAKAKDFTTILILHYLAQKIKGLSKLSGEWVSFKELSGVEGYGDAFRKRVIEPVLRKYGKAPDELLKVLDRFTGKKLAQAQPALMQLWLVLPSRGQKRRPGEAITGEWPQAMLIFPEEQGYMSGLREA